MDKDKDGQPTDVAKVDKSFTAFLVEMDGNNIARLLQKRFDMEYFVAQAVLSIMGKEKEYTVAKKYPHEFLKVVGQQAILGLQSSLGLCHIVAFGNELVLMVDFKGYLEVGHRHPLIKQILARAVYEKDAIDIDTARKPPISHKPSLDDDRGKLRGAYAMVEFVNGNYDYRWCPESEILDIRNKYSKDWKKKGKDSAWGKRPSEFYVKTVVNLLWKMLPKTDEMHQLYKFDNEASSDPNGGTKAPESGQGSASLNERLKDDLPPIGPTEDAEFENVNGTEKPTETPAEKPAEEQKPEIVNEDTGEVTEAVKEQVPGDTQAPKEADARGYEEEHHQRLGDAIEKYGNQATVKARQKLGIMKFVITAHTPEEVDKIIAHLEQSEGKDGLELQ